MQRKSFRLLTLFILLALLSSFALPAFAQEAKPTDPPPAAPEAAPPSAPLGPIGGYNFTNIAPGTYADLTGDTPFTVNGGGGTLDDGYSLDQTLPFPFNFGGSVFTVYRVNTNGWLGFGSPTSTTNYSALNGTVNNVIAFVNRDMNNTGAVYSSVTEGVAPNRIHKIQAKNFYRYNTPTMTGNAQVWLFETTNAIEFHYGAFAQTWTSGTTVQVGLRGASTGTSDVRSLSGTGATTWTSPVVGNSSTSTMALALTVTPDSGRVYRFEPVIAPNLGASTKTATPAVVRTGQNIAYQLVIKNTGDAAATSATISDPIPTGASYVAGSVATQGSPAAVYNGGSNAIEWGAAPLAAGQAVTVTFQVNVTALSGASVVNTATYNATNAAAATTKTTTTPVVGCIDDASYTCADSLNPGPTYNWLDATGGTLILDATTSGGDDRTAAATLPFPFTYYGTTSSDILVGDNGAIVFNATTGSIGFSNTAMSSAPSNFIAPFWDDLDTDTGGTYGQVFGTAPNRIYAVEWYNRPHYSNVGSGTFEVLFHEGTNQITFQYQDVDFGNVSYNNGAGATVGIKGSTIQYSFNAAALSDLLAIQFTPIVPPNANVTPSSLASTQAPNAQVTQPLTIGNTGEADLNWVVEESTVVNGVALPLARSVDHGSSQPTAVQEFKIGDVGLMPAGTGAGQQVTPQRADTPDSLITISHSLSQSIVQFNSVSCNGGSPNFYHTDNSYLRVFDLNAFGISGTFAVTQVEFGIEQALSAGAAGQPLTVNLYIKTNPADPLTFANLTPIGTASVTVPDQNLALFTVPVAGTAPAGSVLVVEVFTPNGQTAGNSFFIGSNGAGQTGPSYIAAADCAIPEPATTASIGFPNMHIVMNVTGDASSLAPCAVPGDIPWLAETPTSGTTAGGTSSTVNVTFDSTGLAPGAYSGDLCVSSDDPDPGPGNGTNLVVVPVALTVQPFTPSIALAKTVGTVPGVCATTDQITVAPGTTVYYCYEVTNTGDVTLNLHDLADSQLGTIFTGLSYALTPGSSINTVQAGLSIPAVINTTTSNTATWTAYNAGPINQVTATDTATVTVQAPNQPAIELNKTVGTVPGVCATTNKVTVPYGTDVFYCYQVENTGNVTMTIHSLVDDQLGALATNLPYVLPPGGFSPQVIVPDTAVITITNTATWTASSSVGYTVNTNAAYNYIPINTTGTALALSDDAEANITIPWGATFFGVTSSNLRVANNGVILFNATTGDVSTLNAALPSATLGLAIAPFWDDIDADTGDVYWEVQGTAPNRMLIVEWYNRPHFSNIGSATFEAILYETTNEIKFQYADVDFGDPLYNNGASATVGLNKDATTALQVSFNQPVIQNGQAILFTPAEILTATDSDFAEVNVQIPNINVNPLSLSSTQPAGSTTNQTLNVGNTGSAPLTWEIAETQPDRPARPGVQPAPEPVFDVPAAVTSEKDCAAFANYPGREPDGWAEFCGQPVEAPASSPSNPTSTGYTLNLRTPDRNLKRFTLNNFPGQTVVGPQAANIYGMDFDSTATTLYALNDAATDELGTLNTTTGVFTPIVACPAPAGGTWTGLSIDPSTNVFYASTATNLYTLNPTTCSPTLIGPFGIASGIMIDIAVNPAGAMYGHDIFTDSIYTINTSTGAATLVGPTGYLANFAQGMDFDNEDGTLYIFLYVGTGVNHYGTVNLATGAVTALASTNPTGEFEGATQTLGVCIPNDYGWLTTAPISGTTAANSVTPVTVTFDATGLTPGTYTAQLCVRSNDPDSGPGNGTSLVQVPVTLTVQQPTAVTLSNLDATQSRAPAPAPAGLPLAALPAAAGLAMAAVYALRRRR